LFQIKKKKNPTNAEAEKAYAEICKEGSTNNWTIVKAGNNCLEQHAIGHGWSNFVEKLCEADNEILFGAFKSMVNDGLVHGQMRPRMVVIYWIGGKIPPKKRGYFMSSKEEIENTFTNISLTIESNERDGLLAQNVAKLILLKTGTDKPIYYDFGDQIVNVSDL